MWMVFVSSWVVSTWTCWTCTKWWVKTCRVPSHLTVRTWPNSRWWRAWGRSRRKLWSSFPAGSAAAVTHRLYVSVFLYVWQNCCRMFCKVIVSTRFSVWCFWFGCGSRMLFVKQSYDRMWLVKWSNCAVIRVSVYSSTSHSTQNMWFLSRAVVKDENSWGSSYFFLIKIDIIILVHLQSESLLIC